MEEIIGEERKVCVVGEIINENHRLWKLMLNIQHGIRYCIGNNSKSDWSSTQPEDLNDPKFYRTPESIYFGDKGESIQFCPKDTMPFSFKQYSPIAFKYLRKKFAIDSGDFMLSICNTLSKSGLNSLRTFPSPGKSGSLFLFTDDMKFLLKTLPKGESTLLCSILPKYCTYIENNPNTLLPKFYGLYKVEQKGFGSIRIVIFENLFRSPKSISERYDLKGSLQGREASEEEKLSPNVTLKDMDFKKSHRSIKLSPQMKSIFVEQLKNDSNFLSSLDIMDYSLLIGIHNDDSNSRNNNSNSNGDNSNSESLGINDTNVNSSRPDNNHIFEGDGGIFSTSNEYYFIGIIDILVQYNLNKRLAHLYKSIKYGKKGEISTVPPNQYAKRFQSFMSNCIE